MLKKTAQMLIMDNIVLSHNPKNSWWHWQIGSVALKKETCKNCFPHEVY